MARCEWTPNYVAFYVDNELRYKNYVIEHNRNNSQYSDKLRPMNIMLGTCISGSNMNDSLRSNTLFPYDFQVDYVRVYKMRNDCDNDFFSTNGGIDYDYSIKRNIYLSGTTPNKRINFIATDNINLASGFNVPCGDNDIEFNIMKCAD